MRWIPESTTLELTARNVQALLDKLDDPVSARTLVSPCGAVTVTATETPGAAEAAARPGTVPLTHSQLQELAVEGAEVRVAAVRVISVTDADHYSDRAAGVVYMPTSGEYR
ncbi:hypothetical protein [Mycolicibacterium aubagnense]|uniref:Uncharacterized protein n=1 Tax=Mycolicibacterium aubagnense TaxID=319707 RepID=A0ABN5Z3W1_9MYCO|nr:hypothetical protein [Mycolicibacterium aubagnense]TLH64296.1 hypothetical protein C1S80_12890 [Mycolicibacterium aubagnense]BBX87952.1 hypothetical protein MAUB_58250 [Mycolicibacterium aubagnense]